MSESGAVRKAVAVVLLLGQLVLGLSGCVSVQVQSTRPSEGPGGGVAVQVFADDSARSAGRPGPYGLMGELQQQQKGGGWRTVFRSLTPTWAVTGLPAGSYRVAFSARLDEAGNVVRLDPEVETFKVKEGKVTEVQVVLEHVSTGLVVAGVITAVVAAVVLSDFLSDNDLPEPPLPPPDLVEAAFIVSLDLAMAGPWVSVSDSSAPIATSHFPADDAVVAVDRPRVVFSFSEPLQAGSVQGTAVTVLGEESGVVAGTVSYDTDRWLVTWTPQEPLPRGDTFHVTLDASQVEDLSGNEPGEPVSFSFQTAE